MAGKEASLKLNIEGAEEALRALERINAELDRIAARAMQTGPMPPGTSASPGSGIVPSQPGIVPPGGPGPTNALAHRAAQPSVPAGMIGSAASVQFGPQSVSTVNLVPANPAAMISPQYNMIPGYVPAGTAGQAASGGRSALWQDQAAMAGVGMLLGNQIQQAGSATVNAYANSIRTGSPVYPEMMTGKYVSAGLTAFGAIAGGLAFGPAGAFAGAGLMSGAGSYIDTIMTANAELAVRRRQLELAYGAGSATGFNANQLAIGETLRARGLPMNKRFMDSFEHIELMPDTEWYWDLLPGFDRVRQAQYRYNLKHGRGTDNLGSTPEKTKAISDAMNRSLQDRANYKFKMQFDEDVAAGYSRSIAAKTWAMDMASSDPANAADMLSGLGQEEDAAVVRLANERNERIELRKSKFANSVSDAQSRSMLNPGLSSARNLAGLLFREASAMESDWPNPSESALAEIRKLRAQGLALTRSATWDDMRSRQEYDIGMESYRIERTIMGGGRAGRGTYGPLADIYDYAATDWRNQASLLAEDDPRRREFLLKAEGYSVNALRKRQEGIRAESANVMLEAEAGMNLRGSSSGMALRTLEATREQLRLSKDLTYQEQLQAQIMEKKASVQEELVRMQEKIAIAGVNATEMRSSAAVGLLRGAGGSDAARLFRQSLEGAQSELKAKEEALANLRSKGYSEDNSEVLRLRSEIAQDRVGIANQQLSGVRVPMSGADRAQASKNRLTQDLYDMGYGSPESLMGSMRSDMGLLRNHLKDLDDFKAKTSGWNDGMEAEYQDKRTGILRQMAGLQSKIDGNFMDAIVAEMSGVTTGQASFLRQRFNPATAYAERGIETMAGGGSARQADYYRNALQTMFGRGATTQSGTDRAVQEATINLTVNVDFVDSRTGETLQTSQLVMRDAQAVNALFSPVFKNTPA